jgi:hypothetical protein
MRTIWSRPAKPVELVVIRMNPTRKKVGEDDSIRTAQGPSEAGRNADDGRDWSQRPVKESVETAYTANPYGESGAVITRGSKRWFFGLTYDVTDFGARPSP